MRLAFAVMRRAMFDSSEMEVPGARHANVCQPSQRIFRTRVKFSRTEDSSIVVLGYPTFPHPYAELDHGWFLRAGDSCAWGHPLRSHYTY